VVVSHVFDHHLPGAPEQDRVVVVPKQAEGRELDPPALVVSGYLDEGYRVVREAEPSLPVDGIRWIAAPGEKIAGHGRIMAGLAFERRAPSGCAWPGVRMHLWCARDGTIGVRCSWRRAWLFREARDVRDEQGSDAPPAAGGSAGRRVGSSSCFWLTSLVWGKWFGRWVGSDSPGLVAPLSFAAGTGRRVYGIRLSYRGRMRLSKRSSCRPVLRGMRLHRSCRPRRFGPGPAVVAVPENDATGRQ
jgi:hypothetical protein